MRSPCTATKSSPRSPQLEKAHVQQQRPNAAKKNQKIKKIKIPRSGVAGSDGRCMFTFLRNCHTIFQSSHSTFHSHQQWVRVPVPTRPAMVSLFNLSPFNQWVMKSHCGFNLQSHTANHLIAFCVCTLGQVTKLQTALSTSQAPPPSRLPCSVRAR